MRNSLLIASLLAISSYSYGCDCNFIIGMKEAYSVFEGKVIAIEKVESPNIFYKIRFRINKVIKGKINTKVIIVNTPSLDVGGCGIPFIVNANYQVYTYWEFQKLYTGDCTKTKILDEGI